MRSLGSAVVQTKKSAFVKLHSGRPETIDLGWVYAEVSSHAPDPV
jgi:hypothetical protein